MDTGKSAGPGRFSAQDGGRWLEFVWKDSGLNVLPEDGALQARSGQRSDQP
jgi:hypothetical protein